MTKDTQGEAKNLTAQEIVDQINSGRGYWAYNLPPGQYGRASLSTEGYVTVDKPPAMVTIEGDTMTRNPYTFDPNYGYYDNRNSFYAYLEKVETMYLIKHIPQVVWMIVEKAPDNYEYNCTGLKTYLKWYPTRAQAREEERSPDSKIIKLVRGTSTPKKFKIGEFPESVWLCIDHDNGSFAEYEAEEQCSSRCWAWWFLTRQDALTKYNEHKNNENWARLLRPIHYVRSR